MKLFLLFLIFMVGCSAMNAPHTQVPQDEMTRVNVQLGIGYLKEGEFQRAKQKLLAAVKQSPRSPEATLAMGYYWSAVGEPSLAESYYKKALTLAPHSGQIQNDYGVFLCQTRCYFEAIHYFILAGENSDYLNQADAYENAALCSLKIPDRLAAKRYFQKALQFNPQSQKSLEGLARLSEF